ncbi:hypothetical protein [Yoonia sp.]|nr:hypothetical protein [Yoonia sp.]
MENVVSGYRALLLLLRINVDWLVFALALLVALYCGSYVMLMWL